MNTQSSAPVGLTLDNLTVPKERTYHTIIFIVSILVWIAVVVSLIGLVYALIFAFLIWIANGLLVAHLRAEAVKVDEQQMPGLYATFRQVGERLGVSPLPSLYVLQAGGVLNAFATKHAGRNFVVVFSDFLESLGPDSPEMKFILGHELGHIKSRHIWKQIFLAPGMLLPLLGTAYRRSWESSCDRHGAYAANDVEGAARAMLTLSGGRGQGRTLNADAFARQYNQERGFFVSLHELTSTYPTLSRRVTDLLALKTGTPTPRASRNPFAYFFALFVPGRGSAGLGNAVTFMVIIGLLAAMAIPAFQKVRQASMMKACINNQRVISAAYDQFVLENGHPPEYLSDLVGSGKPLIKLPVCPEGGSYEMPPDAQSGDSVLCTRHGALRDLMSRASAPTAQAQPQ